ncbi:DUF2071 domain-containing protein [soil metagenome]
MKTIASPASGETARQRLLSIRGEPLFYANWEDALFIHFETEVATLQGCVPFQLDLFKERAFVSLVAFRMRGMRPRIGGRLGALVLKPIATHNFLNVRTYVRHHGEPAIYFMHEWLANRLSVLLGPAIFGLPYHPAKIDYRQNGLEGSVRAEEGSFNFRACLRKGELTICEPGSLGEFLLERYTAFTCRGLTKRFFRIWHEPWRQTSAEVDFAGTDLLRSSGDWWPKAQYIGANYAPGVAVWMGRPHPIARMVS